MKKVILAAIALLLIGIVGALAVAPQAQAKTWKKVTTLSGDTQKEGGYFKLKGGTQKIIWRLSADDEDSVDFVAASIYVMKKGTNLDDDGGFPVAMPDKEGAGSTKLHLKKGSFYLHVNSANCSWVVTVYEWR